MKCSYFDFMQPYSYHNSSKFCQLISIINSLSIELSVHKSHVNIFEEVHFRTSINA